MLLINGADHMTFAGVAKHIPSNFLVRREASTINAETQHHARVAKISTQWWKAQLQGVAFGAPVVLGAGDEWLVG